MAGYWRIPNGMVSTVIVEKKYHRQELLVNSTQVSNIRLLNGFQEPRAFNARETGKQTVPKWQIAMNRK
jgi:hypothetical protein